MQEHPNDPLYGKTLKSILEFLIKEYSFEELGKMVKLKCFTENPSLNSSLKFLRKYNWARIKIEDLYLDTLKDNLKNKSLDN